MNVCRLDNWPRIIQPTTSVLGLKILYLSMYLPICLYLSKSDYGSFLTENTASVRLSKYRGCCHLKPRQQGPSPGKYILYQDNRAEANDNESRGELSSDKDCFLRLWFQFLLTSLEWSLPCTNTASNPDSHLLSHGPNTVLLPVYDPFVGFLQKRKWIQPNEKNWAECKRLWHRG